MLQGYFHTGEDTILKKYDVFEHYLLDIHIRHRTYILMKMLLLSLMSLLVFTHDNDVTLADDLSGAWTLEAFDGSDMTNSGALLIMDGYLFYTEYNIEKKEFVGSMGGQFTTQGEKLMLKVEFDTWNDTNIGGTMVNEISVRNGKLNVRYKSPDGDVDEMVLKRSDDGKGDLAGAWRITDRMRNGEMTAMQMGPRKTIKMITGSRFQWAAYNPETKQFSGTGGGKITLENGKYTEHIEFFSRNADRVGASLTFDYSVDGIKWTHSGLSSSGSPIKEIWTRQNQ